MQEFFIVGFVSFGGEVPYGNVEVGEVGAEK